MKKFTRLSLLFTLSFGCGAPEDINLGESDQSIIGGTTDTGDPAVMMLLGMKPNSNCATLCTATLVAPNVLLTAAHCVSPQTLGNGITFRVYQNDGVYTKPLKWEAVKEVKYDTQFNVNRLELGHDIAVVILQKPITNVKPVPWNGSAFTQSMTTTPTRLVGYGASSGTGAGYGTKRQATTYADSFNSVLLHIGNSQRQTCTGDSGGPAFMKIGGVETLIGVTSFGYAGCVYGGYDTRVDVYRSQIQSWLSAASK